MRRHTRKFNSVSHRPSLNEESSICLLTRQGKKILAQHQAATGQPLFHEASAECVSEGPLATALGTESGTAPSTKPAPSLDPQQAKQQRRKQARARGNRLLTVYALWRGGSKLPDLRMTGLWLAAAGFGLGQEYEVEVEEGKLTIQAV